MNPEASITARTKGREMKTPTAPGIYPGIPYETYAKIDAVSASKLKRIHTNSPRAMHRYRDKDTDTLRQGLAGHTAILEPDRFLVEYALWPAINPENGKGSVRRGAHWTAFEALNVSKTIITEAQYHTALEMRDAARNHPLAGPLLAEIQQTELTILWREDRTGALIKARIDWVGPVLGELKTTMDPRPRVFSRQSARLGYHLQLALYADAWAAVSGEPLPSCVVAVGNTEPFDVVVYDVHPDTHAAGVEQYQNALDTYLECTASGVWPGVAEDETVQLMLPAWAAGVDEEITFGGEPLTT